MQNNTIILGLGSNLGDRVENLRAAVRALSSNTLIVDAVSPLYHSQAQLPPNAPAIWDIPFLNVAVRCHTSQTPHALLATLKVIEKSLGRIESAHWAPKIIDIDILAWRNETLRDSTLHIPHQQLLHRPFALWPLLDLVPDWQHPYTALPEWSTQHTGSAPFQTRQLPHPFQAPYLIGILNLTPDSFSDGGLHSSPETAVAHAKALFDAGSEVIDIGAESTRPNARAISPEEEWQRLAPVLAALKTLWKTHDFKPKISLDTYRPETVEKALAYDIDWINDVSGQHAARIAAQLKGTRSKYIATHSLSIPANARITLTGPATPTVLAFAEQQLTRLQEWGLTQDQCLFDVGIGFGKTAEQSLELLENIARFKKLGVPLVVGHSRKSFLSLFTDKPFAERDLETLVFSIALAEAGVAYLRVHNVKLHAIKITEERRRCPF